MTFSLFGSFEKVWSFFLTHFDKVIKFINLINILTYHPLLGVLPRHTFPKNSKSVSKGQAEMVSSRVLSPARILTPPLGYSIPFSKTYLSRLVYI